MVTTSLYSQQKSLHVRRLIPKSKSVLYKRVSSNPSLCPSLKNHKRCMSHVVLVVIIIEDVNVDRQLVFSLSLWFQNLPGMDHSNPGPRIALRYVLRLKKNIKILSVNIIITDLNYSRSIDKYTLFTCY